MIGPKGFEGVADGFRNHICAASTVQDGQMKVHRVHDEATQRSRIQKDLQDIWHQHCKTQAPPAKPPRRSRAREASGSVRCHVLEQVGAQGNGIVNSIKASFDMPRPSWQTPSDTYSSSRAAPAPKREPEINNVSVSKLRGIWESVAKENGWQTSGGKAWLMAVKETPRKPMEEKQQPRQYASSPITAEETSAGKVVEISVQEDSEAKIKSEISDLLPTAAEPASAITSKDMFKNSISSRFVPMRVKSEEKCDMIVCEVRTRTVDGRKVHEIDLRCEACESSFVLTALHECVPENEVLEAASKEVIKRSQELRGLEWLHDKPSNTDCLNLIL
ncbi:hypothetical protein HDU67_005877 [Dinochytrium kinnereticum]|nr:hypothetical protein HDU67_005877 [Dinochytrium kinnereticum]